MVTAQRRSVHPNVPGVPWWGAVLIALTATAIGFAFDAGGGKELTHVFAALYVIGCIAAVLMVRQAGIFTAIVQPPMILFVSVPGAYFLFHDAKVSGLKDIVINCAYPLIERFPLMVFTSGTVLLIGLARWFIGGFARSEEAPAKVETPSRTGGLRSKIAAIFAGSDADDDEDVVPKRRHSADKPARTPQAAKATKRTEPSRPRRPRSPLAEDEIPERPRRARTAGSWQPEDELPRRRSSGARSARNPYERREPYERRAPHERRNRYDSYDAFEASEAPARRRPGSNGTAALANGTNGSHHPISRVRYRGSPADTETRRDRPVRPRSRSWEADSWEYDI